MSKSASARKWQARNPDKVAAHKAVRLALRTGKLEVMPCELCGKTQDEGHICAHHPDYAKPLEIEWLCASCHRLRHAEMEGKDGGLVARMRAAGPEVVAAARRIERQRLIDLDRTM